MSKSRFKVYDHPIQNSTLNDLYGVDIWDDAEPEYPHPVCRVWFADGSWGEAKHDPNKLIAHILSWDGGESPPTKAEPSPVDAEASTDNNVAKEV